MLVRLSGRVRLAWMVWLLQRLINTVAVNVRVENEHVTGLSKWLRRIGWSESV